MEEEEAKMQENLGLWIGPFVPVMLMLSVVITNHFVSSQRNDKKTVTEASRLSAALAAELRAVLELYKLNLDLIEQKANYLLSARSSIVVYKGNLNRLTLLDASVLERVIGAFAQNERTEAIIAARSVLKCNITYQFSTAETPLDDLKRMYEGASRTLIDACCLLERSVGTPAAFSEDGAWKTALNDFSRRARERFVRNPSDLSATRLTYKL
jgi:hypothetical protein